MAKNKIPKKVGGYKVPKVIRKSSILNALLKSDIGRGILANALTAGAGAAAAVLLSERDEIADATGKGARKSVKVAGLAGEAMRSAAHAVSDVVRNSANDALPKKMRKAANERRKELRKKTGPRHGAVVH